MPEPRILIIDDDAELCEEMTELLASEGYAVDSSMDGVSGLDRLKTTAYHLVILDFKMPGLSGIEALRELKKTHLPPAVLFVSGKPFMDKELDEEQLGGLVGGVVAKPFESDFLLRKVKSLLEGRAGS